MSSLLFGFFWGFVLLIPQGFAKIQFFGFSVQMGFVTLFVIYIGFAFPFFRGLLTVVLLALMTESFSLLPPGFLVASYTLLFVILQVLAGQILTESYLTKSLWVFLFYFLDQLLSTLAFDMNPIVVRGGLFWAAAALQSFLGALASLVLFMIWDATWEQWQGWFSPTKAHLTGADFYQVKSSQRKFLR